MGLLHGGRDAEAMNVAQAKVYDGDGRTAASHGFERTKEQWVSLRFRVYLLSSFFLLACLSRG